MSANGILPRFGGRGSSVSEFLHPIARRVKGAVWLCAALTISVSMFLSVPALAQNDVGSIVGFVTDSSGAVVPNAKVTVKNEGTGESRTVSPDGAGHYAVPKNPPP